MQDGSDDGGPALPVKGAQPSQHLVEHGAEGEDISAGVGFGAWNFVWNPRGCWDWWGYSGAAYHTRDGAQVRAVMAMADRLTAARR